MVLHRLELDLGLEVDYSWEKGLLEVQVVLHNWELGLLKVFHRLELGLGLELHKLVWGL